MTLRTTQRPTLGRLAVLVAMALTGLAATGCSSELKTENALLLEENTDLRARLDERGAALDSLQAQLDSCEQARMTAMDSGAGPAVASNASSGANPFGGMPGVSAVSGGGVVTAVVEGDVLFSSGQSTVRSESRTTLDRIADVIMRDFGGRRVRVSGHTDTDPIRKTRDKFPTNYHLGFARAFAVRQYLVQRGVPADRISVESFGPHVPRGSKSRSRRVEISVVTG